MHRWIGPGSPYPLTEAETLRVDSNTCERNVALALLKLKERLSLLTDDVEDAFSRLSLIVLL